MTDLPQAASRPTQTQRQVEEAARAGARVTVIALLTSVVLAAVKIVAGFVGTSYALIADGVESMLDIMSSLVVWGSLRISTQPPDCVASRVRVALVIVPLPVNVSVRPSRVKLPVPIAAVPLIVRRRCRSECRRSR